MTKDRRPAEEVVHYSRKRWIEWFRPRCARRAERYLKQQGVWTLLTEARRNSKSTGADLWDYAVLHRAVLKHRPSHVLDAVGLLERLAQELHSDDRPAHRCLVVGALDVLVLYDDLAPWARARVRDRQT